MSLDPFDNNSFSPDWGDLDMGWLDLDKKTEPVPPPEPEVKPEPAPVPKPAPKPAPKPMPKPELDRVTPEPKPARPISRADIPEPKKRPEPPKHREPERDPEPWRGREPAGRKVTPERQRPVRPIDTAPEETEPAYLRERRTRGSGMGAPTIILIVVLIGGMLFAGWQLFSIFRNYHRDSSAYEELAARAISGMAEAEATPDPKSTVSPEEETETVSEVPLQIDWDYLASVNPEIIGWLYCPGTVIDYPVMQTSNNDFYLNHGADGTSNTAGALFADTGVVAGITQSNFIVYGHNMKDNSMFGTYKNYVDESYYDEHPVMYYLTPTQCYRIELMCCRIVKATLDNFPTYFSSTSDYQSYLNEITSDAYWVNYSAVSTDYQLITMSTCTSGDDNRLLVQGIMIPIQ